MYSTFKPQIRDDQMHITAWLVIFYGGNYTKTQSTKNRQRQLRRDTDELQIIKKMQYYYR